MKADDSLSGPPTVSLQTKPSGACKTRYRWSGAQDLREGVDNAVMFPSAGLLLFPDGKKDKRLRLQL